MIRWNVVLLFLLVCLCLPVVRVHAACTTERCGKRNTVLQRFTMCDYEQNLEICTFLTTYRQRDGFVCGPCNYVYKVTNCPPAGSVAVLEHFREQRTLHLPLAGRNNTTTTSSSSNNTSENNSLCSLWRVEGNGETQKRKVPVARSYNGHDWEPYAGDYATLQFNCTDDTECTVDLPIPKRRKNDDDDTYSYHHYELATFQHQLSPLDLNARFLEQATFGPTRDEINSLGSDTNYAAWIQQQQTTTIVPATLHRQFYRERWNHRSVGPLRTGIPTHACHAGTRYRRYAFSDKDTNRQVQVQTDALTGRKIILVEGQARTVMDTIRGNDGQGNHLVDFEDGFYQICRPMLSNAIGALIRWFHPTWNECVRLDGGNPAIFFDNQTLPTNGTKIVNLEGFAKEVDAQYYKKSIAQELYLETDLEDEEACQSFPSVTGNPVFGMIGTYKGQLWIHDPRFDIRENTVESPYPDGGGHIVKATQNMSDPLERTLCFSATMNFINEHGCILSTQPDTCGGGGGGAVTDQSGGSIDLTVANFEIVHTAAGGQRYIYAVDGLRQSASEVTYPPPCTAAVTSRWMLIDRTATCSSTSTSSTTSSSTVTLAGSNTTEIFAHLIRSSADSNPFLRDVRRPTVLRGLCDPADEDKYNLRVTVDGACWQNVHRSHWQVYDFTEWVQQHPGGAAAISQFSRSASSSESFVLSFPADHDMLRWNDRAGKSFVDLGRLGDERKLSEAPEVAKAFQDILMSPSIAGSSVVCGSPGEVANRKSEYGSFGRGAFDAATYFKRTNTLSNLAKQKQLIWMDIALKAQDQLRQKVAWTLSQILVISPSTLGLWPATERFVTFYDIFVRHAFGNYRDVLKEVSYSPMMAYMLSYLNGQSTAYVWLQKQRVEYADENYAREVMQLFTIGLTMLHNNGTHVVDGAGNAIQTYSNDDITEYARLWTGLQLMGLRGNLETASKVGYNSVDPMQVNVVTRDNFPKMGLNGKYIGDGMPLCSDLPEKHFLKKGATYRLLGSLPKPNLLRDPDGWATDPLIKRILLQKESALYRKLCNFESHDNGTCRFSSKVVLDEDIPCAGVECDIDSPRVLEVERGLFYEYTRVPCANQAFFADAKLMTPNDMNNFFCGDPRTETGSLMCCPEGSNSAITTFAHFDGERTTYRTLEERCKANGLVVCDMPLYDCNGCDGELSAWSSQGCNLMAKLDLEGKVAIVHASDDGRATANKMKGYVREDTKTFFRVHWTNQIGEKLSSDYEAKCAELGCTRDSYDNLCLCPATVSDTQAFGNTPTRHDVLNGLHIGSFPPSLLGASFRPQDLGGGVVMYSEDGALTGRSIFEVVDGNGVTHWRKNIHSTVLVGTSNLAFRNPPHIMSLANPEPRDGHYEIDAGLDHYFYHQNTAPFLAVRFAQRFGLSNPSPRFVDTMATAFRSGVYKDPSSGTVFGSGEYGDLGAMVAALLLDRESRSEVLDVDATHGSVLEPLLKLVRVMRSLEFEADRDRPFPNFGVNLAYRIGQYAHSLPDVFSFFLPEYTPAGPIGDAGLVCPECMVLTGPRSIHLVNGLLSLVKYGFDSAYNGFGTGRVLRESARRLGSYRYASGRNTYEPLSASSSEDVVDELVRLLTSGRMLAEKRATLIEVYDEALARGATNEAVINVQQLIVSSPEFHTNAISRNDGQVRSPPTPSPPSSKPYKAVIQILLSGGMDSYNMLVPHECGGTNAAGVTVDEQYMQVRGSMALTASERSLLIDVDDEWGQPCSQFALHPELTLLKELYDDGDLVFFANTGVLADTNSTKSDYQLKNRIRLFAHNTMRDETRRADPWEMISGTGYLGRLATVLQRRGFQATSTSIDDPSVALVPELDSAGPLPTIVSRSGVTTFNRRPESETLNLQKYLNESNASSKGYSSFFGDTWSSTFTQGIREAEMLKTYLDAADELGDHWPSTVSKLGERFGIIAKLVNTRGMRGSDRDLFYSNSVTSWDHHDNMKTNLRLKFEALNTDLRLLVQELKHQGVWDDVAIVITSEFGRTLTENSRSGTDHGWGGNYWIMGGSMNGRKILGEYPSDLTTKGPVNLGRGRILPTMSWDSILVGLSEWMGVRTDEDKDYCLPTRQRTTVGNSSSKELSKEDLFLS